LAGGIWSFEFLDGHRALIETQTGLAHLLVRAVAGKAFGRQDRLDVAGKLHLAGRRRQGCLATRFLPRPNQADSGQRKRNKKRKEEALLHGGSSCRENFWGPLAV
jgi:hypothetical protein